VADHVRESAEMRGNRSLVAELIYMVIATVTVRRSAADNSAVPVRAGDYLLVYGRRTA